MRQLGNAINFIEKNDLDNTYEEEQRQTHFTGLHLGFEYFLSQITFISSFFYCSLDFGLFLLSIVEHFLHLQDLLPRFYHH